MSYIDNTIQGWMSPEELLGAWRGKSTHALLSGGPWRIWYELLSTHLQ